MVKNKDFSTLKDTATVYIPVYKINLACRTPFFQNASLFFLDLQGYLFDGVDNTARVCNFESDYDSPLSDANLPLYSNRQCGNPGVYVFETFMDVFPIDPPLSPAGGKYATNGKCSN